MTSTTLRSRCVQERVPNKIKQGIQAKRKCEPMIPQGQVRKGGPTIAFHHLFSTCTITAAAAAKPQKVSYVRGIAVETGEEYPCVPLSCTLAWYEGNERLDVSLWVDVIEILAHPGSSSCKFFPSRWLRAQIGRSLVENRPPLVFAVHTSSWEWRGHGGERE